MTPQETEIRSIAALAEPTRRGLFGYVSTRPHPVSRDEAAAAIGISRPLAAFHLDQLAEVGLLSTEYRRLTGRSGPGAGRPAKLYRVSPTGIQVSIPPRRHGLLASWLARALSASPVDDARRTLRGLADACGQELGRTALKATGRRRSRRSRIEAGMQLLEGEGFAPRMEGRSVLLGNCPFQPIAASYESLVCAEMNQTLMRGFAGVLKAGLVASFEPGADGCCVALRPEGPSAHTR